MGAYHSRHRQRPRGLNSTPRRAVFAKLTSSSMSLSALPQLETALDKTALAIAFEHPAGDLPPISRVRKVIQRFSDVLKDAFFTGLTADRVVRLRAAALDDIVIQVWRLFELDASDHTLLAVGGYGRGELHPYSDIDISILITDALNDVERQEIEGFVRYLMDLGFDVGQSVRTVHETRDAAAADITVITNLMEARVITGPRAIFYDIQAEIATTRMWNSEDFFTAKLSEQDRRHERYNDAFQQLEPNIKESPGGLRDIQVIAWVANRHFSSQGLSSLVGHGFLTEAEFNVLERGRSHLWRIRCALHFLAGRREDRLLFDHQKRVAELFGYTDAGSNRAVEHFMKDFYRTVRELSRLNEILLGLFQEAILQRDREVRTTPLSRRFQVRGNYIEVSNESVFVRTPPALLELFLLMQKNPTIKGVRASTIRLIRANLHLIDDSFRRDIRARSLFMEIIKEPRRIGHELRRMHRYGVLPAYLPAFARVEGLMQFDLFHVYTVDEHLLFVVLHMRRFSYPITEEDQPSLVRQVIERIPKLELLYLAGLFHDVGKGQGKDHSTTGAEDAEEFCQNHGLSLFDTNIVTWLVRNHLLMSNVSQRQDIYDPDVVAAFATTVGDQMRLDYLFLLTIADIRGTNPKLWTSWIHSLLSELYLITLRRMRSGGESPNDKTERIRETQAEARKHIDSSRFSEHAISVLWSTLGDAYFLRHRAIEIAWQTETILGADDADLPVVAVRNFEGRGSTAIFIYAVDMDYLFAISTATLDRLRLDVQDARIITSEANYTLDTYNVLDAETRSPVDDPLRIQEIQSRVRSSISAKEIPAMRTGQLGQRRLQPFKFPAAVGFSIAQAQSNTVMEVIAPDRPGFLSVIGRAMQNCGVRLHDARIATIGERAEDYFYITDFCNQPVISLETQNALRETIIRDLNA
ncbi:MAG: [protein-PII] uridylyltransferase [Gammaproteobacteria bacterium]|nr:[protein-PII] uridylyltransferase [Gammaproteobacteria bacterium]